MIDHDLSDQLHSLAATVDEPFDLVALHRRIAAQSRRRAVVKVGFAGAGVAALVGGLFVVSEERPGSTGNILPAASSVASQADPAAPPACDVVLAGLRAAKSTPDAAVRTNPSASGRDAANVGFKGHVTILTIDGPRLTFHNDEPNPALPTTGAGTVDDATVWIDGPTHLDTPPILQVGQQIGLATNTASDGVDHVVFIDVSASVGAEEETARDNKLTTPTDSATAADPAGAPDTKIVVPGATLQPGPTAKSMGTITAVDATSITVTLDDASGPAKTSTIDPASTLFYADDTTCLPGALTVGTTLGVAYHLDDTGNVISDAVMLMP